MRGVDHHREPRRHYNAVRSRASLDIGAPAPKVFVPAFGAREPVLTGPASTAKRPSCPWCNGRPAPQNQSHLCCREGLIAVARVAQFSVVQLLRMTARILPSPKAWTQPQHKPSRSRYRIEPRSGRCRSAERTSFPARNFPRRHPHPAWIAASSNLHSPVRRPATLYGLSCRCGPLRPNGPEPNRLSGKGPQLREKRSCALKFSTPSERRMSSTSLLRIREMHFRRRHPIRLILYSQTPNGRSVPPPMPRSHSALGTIAAAPTEALRICCPLLIVTFGNLV